MLATLRTILRWRRIWEALKWILRIILEYGPIILDMLNKLRKGRGGKRT